MIDFHYIDIDTRTISSSTVQWLENIILEEEKKLGEINYIICDDEYLLKINQDYLQHDYYTDIITFDYVKAKIISGDIFVSLPRVEDNAKHLGKDMNQEFHRVLAHGILHLCGYKDKTEEEQSAMRAKEDYYLSKLN